MPTFAATLVPISRGGPRNQKREGERERERGVTTKPHLHFNLIGGARQCCGCTADLSSVACKPCDCLLVAT